MRRNLGTIVFLSATLGLATTAGATYERIERNVVLDEGLRGGTPIEFENLIGSITLKGGGDPGRIKVEAQVIAEGEELSP